MKTDIEVMEEELKRQAEAAKEQSGAAIDRSVAQSTAELVKAEQEAREDYQAQREAIDLQEALAKDAQALYAEARGDKGGIGAAQYDSIANTAAENRLRVAQAQTKLAADTAEKIARLRAEGEYEKSDKALSLTQDYLGKLRDLRQWAAEFALSEEKFTESLNQWQAEYDAKMAQMEEEKAQWAAEFDYETRQADLQKAGQALLDLGVLPSESQLAALGYTRAQAEDYMAAAKLAAAAKTAKTAQTTTNSATKSNKMGGEYALYLAAKESGGDPRTYVKSHYKEYGLTALPAEKAYETWAASLKGPLGTQGLETLLGKVDISLSEDTVESTDAMVAKYWPSLTAEQRQKVQKVYEKYGKTYFYGS
ncbi:MAG: hypothetical protein IJX52_01605 [Oscillibacter sp.]|nr:hypothetical protein [Oscillibacter sp.]